MQKIKFQIHPHICEASVSCIKELFFTLIIFGIKPFLFQFAPKSFNHIHVRTITIRKKKEKEQCPLIIRKQKYYFYYKNNRNTQIFWEKKQILIRLCSVLPENSVILRFRIFNMPHAHANSDKSEFTRACGTFMTFNS